MLTLESLKKKIKAGEKIALFHGSKGGITGNIEPRSRDTCDFGTGFYMGTNPDQARGLVVTHSSPFFYKVSCDFSKVNPEKILFLDGQEWLYTVLAFRRKSSEFSALNVAKAAISKADSGYDFVIGAIADDRVNNPPLIEAGACKSLY